tara:strand:+ start:731 stop:943 length:213 start_codon:yes stop_codon:yes gene_type:complete
LKGLYGGQGDFITKPANTDTLSRKMNVEKMIDNTVSLAISVLRKRLRKYRKIIIRLLVKLLNSINIQYEC